MTADLDPEQPVKYEQTTIESKEDQPQPSTPTLIEKVTQQHQPSASKTQAPAISQLDKKYGNCKKELLKNLTNGNKVNKRIKLTDYIGDILTSKESLKKLKEKNLKKNPTTNQQEKHAK